MNGIVASRVEQHIVDHGVAVALLLAMALLLVHLVWQPAKRLSIIQWSLIGGLLLVPGVFVPMHLVSLGLLGRDHTAESEAALLPDVDDPSPTDHCGASTIPETAQHDQAPSSIAAENCAHAWESRVGGDGAKHLAALPQQPPDFGATESDQSPRVILFAYITGATGMMIWLALGQYRVRWLLRRACEADGELARSWERLLCGMQPELSRRAVRLFVSDSVSYPMAVGILRPAVLLPRWLVATCAVEQLLPVLAHEAAHTLHRDAVLRWLAAVFQVVFFYQPLYWLLRRELRLCQEYLADSEAVAYARSAPEYAEQLVSLLNAVPKRSWRPLPTMGIIEGRSELYRRIQMLVQSSRRIEARGSGRWNLAISVALVALALCLASVTLWAADPSPAATPGAKSSARAAEAAARAKSPAAKEKPNEVIRLFLTAICDGETDVAEKLLSPKSRETNKDHHFIGEGERSDMKFIIQDATYPFRDIAHVAVSFGTDGAIYVLKRHDGQWLITGMIGLENGQYEVIDFEDASSIPQGGPREEFPAKVVENYFAAARRGDVAAARECFSADARQLPMLNITGAGKVERDETMIDYKVKGASYPFAETAHVAIEVTIEGQAKERHTDDSIMILKRRKGKWQITGMMCFLTHFKLSTEDAAAKEYIEKRFKNRTVLLDFEDPGTLSKQLTPSLPPPMLEQDQRHEEHD